MRYYDMIPYVGLGVWLEIESGLGNQGGVPPVGGRRPWISI